jgi:hypothetical protein
MGVEDVAHAAVFVDFTNAKETHSAGGAGNEILRSGIGLILDDIPELGVGGVVVPGATASYVTAILTRRGVPLPVVGLASAPVTVSERFAAGPNPAGAAARRRRYSGFGTTVGLVVGQSDPPIAAGIVIDEVVFSSAVDADEIALHTIEGARARVEVGLVEVPAGANKLVNVVGAASSVRRAEHGISDR